VSAGALTLTWSAPIFGPVTRYLLEAGTGSGLSNLAVLDTGSTGTSIVIPGVPRGRYFLRLRAINALGTSPPSNELEVVVP
jgi:hypothetical protein